MAHCILFKGEIPANVVEQQLQGPNAIGRLRLMAVLGRIGKPLQHDALPGKDGCLKLLRLGGGSERIASHQIRVHDRAIGERSHRLDVVLQNTTPTEAFVEFTQQVLGRGITQACRRLADDLMHFQ